MSQPDAGMAVWEVSMVRTLRAFISDERASASMEFVLWVPGFIFLLVMVTDASILYLTHTEMWNAARDTARGLSVGALTVEEAPDRARERLLLSGRTYTVAVSDADPVVVQISVSVGDASIFGFFEPVLEQQFTARVEMMKEPVPPTF